MFRWARRGAIKRKEMESSGMCGVFGLPSGLVDGRSRYVSGPIGLREFHTPEVRAGREEFDAHARPLVRGVADVDDPALLLFLGGRVDQDHLGAKLKRFLEIDEPAVRVDHDRLADLAELAAVGVLPGGADRQAGKDPRTPAFFAVWGVRHHHQYRATRGGVSQLRQTFACL